MEVSSARDPSCEEEAGSQEAGDDGDDGEDGGHGLACLGDLEGETCQLDLGLGIQMEAASYPGEASDLASRMAWAPAFS